MSEQDIRVIKSKKAIRDALFSILDTKPINRITIKELATAANVNRKTFYAHYNCIEDIVNELENELIQSIESYLHSCFIEEYGLSPIHFVRFINTIYTSNPEFCEKLVAIHNYHFLAGKVKTIFKEELMKTINPSPDMIYATDLRVEYFISGVSGIYIEWIRSGKPCTFEELTEIMNSVLIDSINFMESR